ncbi:hypothetical protein SK128_012646, partial [Halocaridina rubra]
TSVLLDVSVLVKPTASFADDNVLDDVESGWLTVCKPLRDEVVDSSVVDFTDDVINDRSEGDDVTEGDDDVKIALRDFVTEVESEPYGPVGDIVTNEVTELAVVLSVVPVDELVCPPVFKDDNEFVVEASVEIILEVGGDDTYVEKNEAKTVNVVTLAADVIGVVGVFVMVGVVTFAEDVKGVVGVFIMVDVVTLAVDVICVVGVSVMVGVVTLAIDVIGVVRVLVVVAIFDVIVGVVNGFVVEDSVIFTLEEDDTFAVLGVDMDCDVTANNNDMLDDDNVADEVDVVDVILSVDVDVVFTDDVLINDDERFEVVVCDEDVVVFGRLDDVNANKGAEVTVTDVNADVDDEISAPARSEVFVVNCVLLVLEYGKGTRNFVDDEVIGVPVVSEVVDARVPVDGNTVEFIVALIVEKGVNVADECTVLDELVVDNMFEFTDVPNILKNLYDSDDGVVDTFVPDNGTDVDVIVFGPDDEAGINVVDNVVTVMGVLVSVSWVEIKFSAVSVLIFDVLEFVVVDILVVDCVVDKDIEVVVEFDLVVGSSVTDNGDVLVAVVESVVDSDVDNGVVVNFAESDVVLVVDSDVDEDEVVVLESDNGICVIEVVFIVVPVVDRCAIVADNDDDVDDVGGVFVVVNCPGIVGAAVVVATAAPGQAGLVASNGKLLPNIPHEGQ